jgi:CRP-like cAMP-binding protein
MPSNRVLLALPQATLTGMRRAFEFVELERKQVINHADERVKYIYFVNRGLVSLVKTMQDGRTVEIGVVGVEGLTDSHSLLGFDRAPMEAIVQIPGTAFRIRRDELKELMADDKKLRDALEKYANFSLLGFAQTAACNRLHHLEERCCRWLLIAQDSALSDTFSLTHEFLAMMLGVHRAGVSITASFLQKAGLIQYKHGQVSIINRGGLEAAACECYANMGKEFEKLFPTAAC